MSRSLHARPTSAAGERWMKFAEPALDLRFAVKHWWEYGAGQVGFWLICASLGGLLAVLVR